MSASPSRAVDAPVVVIAIVLMAGVLVVLRSILTPLALAFFLMVGIDGLARAIAKPWPRLDARAALALSMAVVVVAVLIGVMVLANGARTFIADARTFGPRLDLLASQAAHGLGAPPPPPVRELMHRAHLGRRVLGFARAFEDIAAEAAFVLIYLGFLFASRAAYERKARRLFSTPGRTDQALRAADRIRTGIETYILLQSLTSLIIAGASFVLMLAVGLKDAPFWAFLIFIASYIPVIGGAVSIFLPPLFALMQFDSHWRALVLLVGGEAIHMFVGNVVAPRMQGNSLNIDPLVVVISLVFWDALWGAPGAFLSTPLTVTAIVVLCQFPGARWVAVLMSRDGDPERTLREQLETSPVTQA